jgi:hypothetical protein
MRNLYLLRKKWLRKIEESAILVKDEDYTLGVNENKRELIYNPWGDLILTTPFKLNNGKVEFRAGAPRFSHIRNPSFLVV